LRDPHFEVTTGEVMEVDTGVVLVGVEVEIVETLSVSDEDDEELEE